MYFNIGDRVQVIKINIFHTKRQITPLSIMKGKKGIIIKLSSVEDNAYYVRLDGIEKSVYFYHDELISIR